MPQQQGVNSLGGFASTASIDAELRQRATHTTYFEQMTLIAASYGKHRSSQLFFDKLGRLATAMNQSGIGELDTVPETTFPLVQGTITATEYANSVAWTQKLETYSQFPIAQMVAQALRQDQIEGLDKVAFAAYALGRVVYTPLTATTGVFSTTGTAASIAGSVMTISHVKDITDNLRTNSIPALSEGCYFAICHVDHVRGIKDSTEWIDVSKYHQPEKLFYSEIGKYSAVRFVEENNAQSSPAGTNTVGFAQATYVGSDNCLQAIAEAPHMRYGIPLDFGRDRREGHFYNGGFVLAWRYDTDGGEEHQIRADSL
jgi:N4-gp56 family major capsid protein